MTDFRDPWVFSTLLRADILPVQLQIRKAMRICLVKVAEICSSGSRAGCPVIGKSLVRSLGSPSCSLKYP